MKLEDKIREMVITIKNLSAGYSPPSNLVDTCTERIMEIIEEDYRQTRQALEKDILILVLRLMGENLNTFSGETADVMSRWLPAAAKVLRGERGYKIGD